MWQTPNQLLNAIMTDIEVPEYLAGCRALGLVNKIITAPLWQVMELRDTSILDMNWQFETLLTCLERWSKNASVLLAGEANLFENFPPTNDKVYLSLTTPSDCDDVTQIILQVLCSALSALLSHLVEDHLPGGKLSNPSDTLSEQAKSVPTANTISERDFGKLDQLLREKPNATTLSLEFHILFSNTVLHLKIWPF